jgi:exosome complex protein LRP1
LAEKFEISSTANARQQLFIPKRTNTSQIPIPTMDTADLTPLVEDLEANIDELEAALKPLLDSSISATAAKLPVLDRTKLFVLVTYAIESLIFSHVRLTGADGKTHPVFRELQRVKQYFEKIEKAENPVGKRENLSLNKPAAARFIKAALAGNVKFDQEVEDRKMRDAQAAKSKLEALNKKRKVDGVEEEESSSSSSEEESSDGKYAASLEASKGRKRVKASDMMDEDAKSEKKGKKKSNKVKATKKKSKKQKDGG